MVKPTPTLHAAAGRPSEASSPAPSPRPPRPLPPALLDRPIKGPWLQWGVVKHFEWNRADLPIENLPPAALGLKILHLTDLHLRKVWEPAHQQLIERVEEAHPDLILITGDFVDNKVDHRPALPLLRRLLEPMRARLGIFGITGNHDGPNLPAHLEGMNVTLLEGRTQDLTPLGAPVELVGLPGPMRNNLTDPFIASVPPPRPGVVRIVLSHYPDHIRRVGPLRPQVLLAGHTHGGQCCLPGGFMLLRHDSLRRRYCHGIHPLGRTWLVVGRGLGYSGPPLRLFCPPEVMELRLTAGPRAESDPQ